MIFRKAVRKDDVTAEKTTSLLLRSKDLFGRHGSGKSDLSINRKRYVREAIRAKRAH